MTLADDAIGAYDWEGHKTKKNAVMVARHAKERFEMDARQRFETVFEHTATVSTRTDLGIDEVVLACDGLYFYARKIHRDHKIIISLIPRCHVCGTMDVFHTAYSTLSTIEGLGNVLQTRYYKEYMCPECTKKQETKGNEE